MRRAPTGGERDLRDILKQLHIDGEWERQVPMLGYILDFFSAKYRTVIEVDGSVHNKPEQRAKDRHRDEALWQAGRIATLRFTNTQVALAPGSVGAAILRRIQRHGTRGRRPSTFCLGRRGEVDEDLNIRG